MELPNGANALSPPTAPYKTLAEIEREYILVTLEKFNGDKTRTAVALDITIKTLYNKLVEYGVHVPRVRASRKSARPWA